MSKSQKRGCYYEWVKEHIRTPQPSEKRERRRRGDFKILRSSRIIFKLVIGGSNMLELAPKLVSLFLTLGTSI
jgi:hypothetical protein